MYYFIKTVFLLSCFFAFTGCKRDQPLSESKDTVLETGTAVSHEQIEPTATASGIVVKKSDLGNWLAKLTQQKNQVEYRQRNHNIWQPAEINLVFMKYDALQTKNSSLAEVIYQSGSILDIKENTLLIFDEDPGQKKKAKDRVIIKNGQLTGKTKTELWIFTDSGLVQIKAKKDSTDRTKQAEANVIVKNDKAVNVKVKRGSAEVIYKKAGEFNRVVIAENSDINIKPNSEVLTVNDLMTAQAQTKSAAQASLVIDFPADNALVKESQIETRGRLTGAGSKLLINGELVEISNESTFAKKITLQAGTNLIVFQLVRSDASVKFIKRNVRYQAQ